MHPQLESIFDEAETRYLKPEELGILNQYVESLPERLDTYRRLRDQEIEIMQPIADQLQQEFPAEPVTVIERSLKNAILVLRHCAMSMLLNDESFVQKRLLDWLEQTTKAYNTQAIDTVLYRLLNQRLSQVLTPQQLSLVKPPLMLAQNTLLNNPTVSV